MGAVAAAAVAGGLTLGTAPAALAQANPSTPAPGSVAAQQADSVPGMPGLPVGVPPAATAPLPTLPAPTSSEWPFPDDWSQTEGTGHLDGGADLWTDFVYDDHGPADNPATQDSASGLAMDHGGFTYPTGAGYDEGNADIFGAGIGYDANSQTTYWRVDWASMPSPSIPIAEWTMKLAGSTPATTDWPANAGVQTSTGISEALVVTSSGAELLAANGTVQDTFATQVDPGSYSFIVAIPAAALAAVGMPLTQDWDVQLASGLNGGGDQFATVPAADGGVPGGANVYNITYRRAQTQEGQLVCPDYPFDQTVAATLEDGLANDGDTEPGVPTVECANNWMENDQANTLLTQVPGTAPDVSKYSHSVDWAQLAAKTSTPQPLLAGYSNRWYVTPLAGAPGSPITGGMRAADSATYTGPTYLDRIQVYAVEVPQSYVNAVEAGTAEPTPLTWILHSLGSDLNQYGGTDPTQVTQECDDRGSICATTEGFSEGQWYYGEAEVDFFDVWQAMAASFDLDPDATAITGYSMGGWASYKLAEEYPDLFAQAMPLEGPVICGEEVTPSTAATPYVGSSAVGATTAATGYSAGTQCQNDSDSAAAAPADVQGSAVRNTTPPLPAVYDPLSALDNLYWIPYEMTCGTIDELVPVTSCDTEFNRLEADGLDVYEALYPSEDHLVFATQNDFTPTDDQLGTPALDRKADPGHFSYTWYPDLAGDEPTGVDGIGVAGDVGPTGAYWVSGLAGRTTTQGTTASVVASSAAIPDPTVTGYDDTTTPEAQTSPTPYVANQQTRELGATPAPQQTVTLDLADVGTVTLDTVGAGLTCGTVTTTTDGTTALALTRLEPGSQVSEAGTPVATAGGDGEATVQLPSGTTTLSLCSALTVTGPVAATPEAPLAIALPLAAIAVGFLGWRLRRRRNSAA
jgi:dienelactone hydrolase